MALFHNRHGLTRTWQSVRRKDADEGVVPRLQPGSALQKCGKGKMDTSVR